MESHKQDQTDWEEISCINIWFCWSLILWRKVLHVSAQKGLQYEANWRMKPRQLWIQRTREHRKWSSDHQDIPILAKHVILGWCGEISVSDWVGRPQTYLWRPEELFKVSNYVFKDYLITKYNDIMHLLLSKEPSTNFRKALKNKRRHYKKRRTSRSDHLILSRISTKTSLDSLSAKKHL